MIKYAYIMKSVIAFMLLWIGANTDYNVQLPAPKIIMLPHAELVEAFGNKSTNGGGTLKAFYKPSSDTIYLEDDFNIHDPWKKAILFHELFHYVQDQNGFRPKCVQEWERDVYPLQKKYLLEVHGLDWEYDELWYKLISTCPTN